MSVRRWYRFLLLAWPAEFRRRFGEAAARDFEQLHADARRRGAVAVVRLWVRTVWTVVGGGLAEQRVSRERARMVGRGWLDVAREARLAWRGLARSPGFAWTTVALVGLGIGATTTMFSVVDGVLLRPLPYPVADRLVYLTKESSKVPIPDFVDVRASVTAFDAVGASWTVTADLTGAGEPERLEAALVSRDFFEVVGARAHRGRLFAAEEYEPGVASVAVVSASLWLRKWGGDPGLVGRTITLHGRPVTVVGVLDPGHVPPEALGMADTELYQPLDVARAEWQNRTMFVLGVIGRLAPDRSFEGARAQLDALAMRLTMSDADGWRRADGSPVSFRSAPLADATVDEVGAALWVFLAAVFAMLAIACANVANLNLARALERGQEMSVRAALGAGHARIVAQLLMESVTLALIGGVLGVLLAFLGVRVFVALAPASIPRLVELSVDVRVLAFAVIVSTLTGVIFGLAPALLSARARMADALREAGRGATVGRSRARLRNGLVVLQVALALVLLSAAGILGHSFLRLRGVDTGFEADGLLTLQLDTDARVLPDDRDRHLRDLLGRVAALPGVRAAGASWRLPFDRGRCCWSARTYDPTTEGDTLQPYLHPVTSGYFEALGVPVREGRDFRERESNVGRIPGPGERATAGRIPVIVSRAFAERMWPDRGAVGRSFVLRGLNGIELSVIGVIDGIRHWALAMEPGQDVYLPFEATAAWHLGLLDLAIRHDGPVAPLAAAVRGAVYATDPHQPISRIATMESRMAGSSATPRFQALVLMTFAALAFLLAAGGVYGSMLYVVGLRGHEMGIRVALGAERGDVMRLVVGRGAWLIGTGVLIGLGATFGASRYLQSLVFEVSTADPLALSCAALALAGAGLLACWLPARRAARSDPVRVLRAGGSR